ncbi:MAG: hypothetical protein IT269_13825 [Saprospiraceae bacterium]|nr:hypothetical protein [Saprospiraceae bacterium]
MRFYKFGFLMLLLFAAVSLSAQSRRTPHSREEEPAENPLNQRLWYGGGFQLGFSGFNGGNVFSFGLSPMVGYKVFPKISVGPRVSAVINSIKIPGFKATGLWDIDAGAFVRGRVFQGLFLQGELSNQWYQQTTGYGVPGGKLDKYSLQRSNTRIGAGWNNSQGGWSSEIAVFYNLQVANDVNTYLNPCEYRFGITYRY